MYACVRVCDYFTHHFRTMPKQLPKFFQMYFCLRLYYFNGSQKEKCFHIMRRSLSKYCVHNAQSSGTNSQTYSVRTSYTLEKSTTAKNFSPLINQEGEIVGAADQQSVLQLSTNISCQLQTHRCTMSDIERIFVTANVFFLFFLRFANTICCTFVWCIWAVYVLNSSYYQ